MLKKLLTDQEYTITNNTTIVIDAEIDFEPQNLNLIVRTSDNEIVYNFACEDLKASINKNVITLLDKSILTTDDLTIIMSFDEGSEIEKLEDITLWSKKVHSTLNYIAEQQTETNKLLRKIYSHE